MLTRFLSAGCGAGYVPVAPGTAGSVAGLLLGLLLLKLSPVCLAGFVVVCGLGGIWVVAKGTGIPVRPDAGVHDDPGWVVLDEIAGQCLALLALPRPSWAGAALAFALFRLFDIWKPGPVGWADRQGGAWGIMADDLLAGFAACLIVGGAHARWPQLV